MGFIIDKLRIKRIRAIKKLLLCISTKICEFKSNKNRNLLKRDYICYVFNLYK